MNTRTPSPPSEGSPDLTCEFNFDGLIGPTHHFAGIAPGNLASAAHRGRVSHPRAAAHQGLEKMCHLMRLGIPQAVLPPHARPNLRLLRAVGFTGTDPQVLSSAGRQAPRLLSAAMSGSSMWTANAATVCPSADSSDQRVHFTPANLVAALHRASEPSFTSQLLRRLFSDESLFAHHPPLPSACDFGDEGAANHSRFCSEFGTRGIQFFVYGSDGSDTGNGSDPKRFRARQTRQASESVARLHGLDSRRVVFARQSSAAIDAGVFHNDVIAVGHRELLLCHEDAFADQNTVLEQLSAICQNRLAVVQVSRDRLPLDRAVATYLFNSQIVTTATDETILIAPRQCERDPQVSLLLKEWISEGVFDQVLCVDVDQSMNNGGGPACLRLRVVLAPAQASAMSQGVVLSESLAEKLKLWIDRHYREELAIGELADPKLMQESFDALDALTGLLDLGSLYEFQTKLL